MKHSEQINELAAALAKAQGQYKPVPKNKTAKVKTKAGYEYSYKYADWADVLTMAIPALSAQNLALTQFLRQGEAPVYKTDNKGEVVEIIAPCYLQSRLLHSSGQWIESEGVLLTQQADKQAFGSELSYARRYDGCSLLGIMPDEDEDGKIATDNARAAKKPKGEVIQPPSPPAEKKSVMKTGVISPDDRRAFFESCYRVGGNDDMIRAATKQVTGQDSTKSITYEQAETVRGVVQNMVNPDSLVKAMHEQGEMVP